MKKYKIMSLLAAAFLGMAGFTSCTNDDTVDEKAKYNISFESSSLDADAKAAFTARATEMLYAEETDNTRWIDFGLYCSRDYAQNSYNAVKTSKYEFIQDSLVNIIADQYNLAPGSFTVTMLLKDEAGSVIDNSATWQPTIERKNLTITLTAQSNDGEDLAENLVQTINDSIVKIYGSEAYLQGKSENITEAYAKKLYGTVLGAELQSALTNISIENNFEQNFSVYLNIEGGEDDYDVEFYPITTYTVKYVVEQGSLSDAQVTAISNDINTYVIGSAALSSYDIQKATLASANQEFENLLRKANSVLQDQIVNGTAQATETNDFWIEMQLVAADGTIVNFKVFEPEMDMDIYTVNVEVTGVSDESLKTQLMDALGDGKNVGLHTLAKAMDIFKTNVEAAKAKDIINTYAIEKKNISFDVDFVLVNSKGVSVDVISYSAKDSWTFPTE